MKNFFVVIFGGIIAVSLGVTLFFYSKKTFDTVAKKFPNVTLVGLASAVVDSKPVDGTSISGMKRVIRYTASEEEGLMTAATLSLPRSSDSSISAKSYLIQNLKNNKVIEDYDENRLLPIASLTKLVTAVVAKKLLKDSTKVKITSEVTSVYGNTAQFKIGETFRVEDLYYPLLMVSSNDSAEALARSYGRKKFIQAMNDFVQSIGAYRTTFVDPSGLSVDNRSTANDLVTIYTWIMKNEPELIEITKEKTKVVRNHTWTNPAHFLSWSNYAGGKNGYTDEAKQTGVAVFNMDKVPYIVVILGSRSRDADIVKLLGKVQK